MSNVNINQTTVQQVIIEMTSIYYTTITSMLNYSKISINTNLYYLSLSGVPMMTDDIVVYVVTVDQIVLTLTLPQLV